VAISKKLRFEIFKRDNFQCKYCGKKVPDVVLELDHIIPRSKNGLDDIANLITSCFDCNRGKSDRKIEDRFCREDIDYNLEIEKMKDKQAQLKEYYKWLKKTKLSVLENPEIRIINERISDLLGWTLTEVGASSILNSFLKDNILTIDDILDSIDILNSKNICSIESQFKYLCGILWKKKGAINEN